MLMRQFKQSHVLTEEISQQPFYRDAKRGKKKREKHRKNVSVACSIDDHVTEKRFCEKNFVAAGYSK